VAHGVPIRVIPGISAGIGGLAYAGIPVTHRDVNQSVTFITGHDQSGAAPQALDWAAIARASEVLVIYMGLKHAAEITGALLAAGRAGSEPAAIVRDATLPSQEVVETTLAELSTMAARMEPPAILVIGRNVLMRQVLDWQGIAAGAAPRDLDPLRSRERAESA
jgi:uroporphyrin-III C-methyltransferase